MVWEKFSLLVDLFAIVCNILVTLIIFFLHSGVSPSVLININNINNIFSILLGGHYIHSGELKRIREGGEKRERERRKERNKVLI